MKNLVIVFLLGVIVYMYLGKKKVKEIVLRAQDKVKDFVQPTSGATGYVDVPIQEVTAPVPEENIMREYYYGDAQPANTPTLNNPIYLDKSPVPGAFVSYTTGTKRRSSFGR